VSIHDEDKWTKFKIIIISKIQDFPNHFKN